LARIRAVNAEDYAVCLLDPVLFDKIKLILDCPTTDSRIHDFNRLVEDSRKIMMHKFGEDVRLVDLGCTVGDGIADEEDAEDTRRMVWGDLIGPHPQTVCLDAAHPVFAQRPPANDILFRAQFVIGEAVLDNQRWGAKAQPFQYKFAAERH
jgi:hypothetical protein